MLGSSALGGRICWRCRISLAHASRRRLFSAKKPVPRVPETACRTRFAPSPTGDLHLGSLRTALFNYLLAKATKGKFILRIEDTDQARTLEGAEQGIYDDLKWAGLSWDEGPDVGGPYGPYRQSERKELYAARVRQLLKAGKAYRCFCSPAELDAQQRLAYQRGEMAIYPGACLHISPEESEERAAKGDAYAVRFKTRKREVMFKDLVYGRYAKGSREGDFIIMKRDGYPTYHFANVVDDHLMKVSHVIRGAEWLISTPRHIELYGAFGWTPPEYAHVGLLVDRKRAKLSKRSPGIGLSWYRSNHVLPQAVLNFAVLLGWSTPRKKQVMTLDELADEFTLKFTKGDIIVDLANLQHFQKHHAVNVVKQSTSNPESALTYLVRPISGIILGLEEGRRQGALNTEDHEAMRGSEELSALTSNKGVAESLAVERYVSLLLQIGQIPESTDFRSFVMRNRHLIWSPNNAVLKDSMHSLLEGVTEFRLHGNVVSFEELVTYVYECFLLDETQDEAAEWTDEKLEEKTEAAVEAISWDVTSKAGNKDVSKAAGYKLLRWALAASASGPSAHRIALLLGRSETAARLLRARDVAKGQSGHLLRDGSHGAAEKMLEAGSQHNAESVSQPVAASV